MNEPSEFGNSCSVRRLLALLVVLLPASAGAGELQADLGFAGRGSTWRGDGGGGPHLGAGYRFAQVFAIDLQIWEELFAVDKRVNTGITFGLTGTLPLPSVRPSLRVYGIHQHEEGLVSIEDHPFGTVFGIGTGIRHRAGGGVRLGLEIPFSKGKSVEWVALAGLEGTWLVPKALGPAAYYGATAGIGINYRVEGLP